MSDFNTLIGKKIVVARKANGLSQRSLAQKLKISQQVLSGYERGRTSLPLEVFINICISLDAPVSWFVQSIRQYGDIVSEEEIELLSELKKFSDVSALLDFIKRCFLQQSNVKKRRVLPKSVSLR